ncbi:ABC transporter permease subunit [Pseudoalteromonas obscura]|uniref:ABC transporter permease subunit n=1 Tax=Pseudoalteromonas obscura TaxID=3048491 RepID=A0ABT7EGC3_9GAMM|nr:ABC transporter permease subunit [Pseudoalteromonas sp. P94(2023)]MDK2594093.1 ABC transporter permease subunit [Pseudoalteromonas sp. P94(2023)]
MNLQRTWLFGLFELTRLFATKRGWLAIAAFSLVWLMVLRYPIYNAVPFINSYEFSDIVGQIAGTIGLSALVSWPEAELAMFWIIGLFTFPMFAVFVTADQTVGDRNRGTLRFLTMRSTRLEILLGRFIGQVMILAALIALVTVATLIMLLYRDASLLTSAFAKSIAIWSKLLLTCLPFIALMSLLNLINNSARMSIVFAILFFTLIASVIGYVGAQYPVLSWLNYIIPGHQIAELTGWQNTPLFSYALPACQTAILLGAAHVLLKGRDL